MKKFLSSRGLFVSGFILLVLINIIVLSGVAYNRSGDPAALIWLTERELKMSYRSYEENSGLSLCLDWRTLDKNEEYRGYSSFVIGNSPSMSPLNSPKQSSFVQIA